MKHFLLFVGFLFSFISSFAQGEGELVSDNITILKDYSYRMYIKSYSDLAIQKTDEGKKFAVKYISDDNAIVEPQGNVFKGLTPGSTTLTMQLSTVLEGSNDSFDSDNIVMTKTFNVTVTEDDPIQMPIIDISWGTPREQVIKTQESEYKHQCITDHYYSHFPNVVENNPEYVKQLEIFHNDNFEAPVTICQFTEDEDLLVATSVLFASWDRVTFEDSYVYKWLVDKGFEAAPSESYYWNLSYNYNGILTHASWESVVIDNVWYSALQLNYDGVETGIDNVEQVSPMFDIQTIDNIIIINAGEYAGSVITICDVNGRTITSSIINKEGNKFTVPSQGLYLVKIDGYKAVKVLL